MDELRNAIKEKTERSVDRLVKATDSPFTTAVWNAQCRRNSSCLSLSRLTGLRKDLQDHLNTFKMTLGLQQPPEEILCRSFPTTLKGAAREWFIKLLTSLVDNFKQLSNTFLCYFIGG